MTLVDGSAARRLEIKPITRIEGHAEIELYLDDDERIVESRFKVLELRGFESFLLGRMVWELPLIVPRICGICSVSHHLASTMAVEAALQVEPPRSAVLQREVLNLAQLIHSHAEHLFYLALPDLVDGIDDEDRARGVVAVAQQKPATVKRAVKLRKLASQIIEICGGRAIHPVAAIPGGMSQPIGEDAREALVRIAEEMLMTLAEEYLLFDGLLALEGKVPDIDLRTSYLTLTEGVGAAYNRGTLTILDADGNRRSEYDVLSYDDIIVEETRPYSYTKFPRLRDGAGDVTMLRVGPLARLNATESFGMPAADELLQKLRAERGDVLSAQRDTHAARFIEMIMGAERIRTTAGLQEFAQEPHRVPIERKAGRGVGAIEAPRGTLIHDYSVDANGKVTAVNLIVSTTFNNPAIDESVRTLAQGAVSGGALSPQGKRDIERAVRTFDPCLSCSTHLYDANGIEVEVIEVGTGWRGAERP